jgi:hypothetical protein
MAKRAVTDKLEVLHRNSQGARAVFWGQGLLSRGLLKDKKEFPRQGRGQE